MRHACSHAGDDLRNTIVHPVVLPVLAGLAWNASGSSLPTVADEILQTLGQAVVPLCLVLIGVSLAYYGLRGAVRSASVLSVVKLRPAPALVLVFARWGSACRRAARDRRDDGGAAGRQQRADLRPALRHPARRDEHGHRRFDARLRGHAPLWLALLHVVG